MFFTTTSGRFVPGRLLAMPGAMNAIGRETLLAAYCRHLHCDWGDVSESDWKRNDEALLSGERLFSMYRTEDGLNFWIITEADRSCTTMLLPEDY